MRRYDEGGSSLRQAIVAFSSRPFVSVLPLSCLISEDDLGVFRDEQTHGHWPLPAARAGDHGDFPSSLTIAVWAAALTGRRDIVQLRHDLLGEEPHRFSHPGAGNPA